MKLTQIIPLQLHKLRGIIFLSFVTRPFLPVFSGTAVLISVRCLSTISCVKWKKRIPLYLGQESPKITARTMAMLANRTRNPWNLIWNFAQLPQSSLAAANAPNRHPEVGTMKFVKASPS